jgi:DNA-binding beta-propeller fold protein YncE
MLVVDASNMVVRAFSSSGTGAVVSLPYAISVGTYSAIDATGNFYIADASLQSIIVVTQADSVSSLIGSGFANPVGVAVDHDFGFIYVSDGNQVIWQMTPQGTSTLKDSSSL